MNNLLNKCKNYDLIGIGELTHGELTSWKYRYKIVKYLTKYYDNVIIFCETLDPYISDLNIKDTKFTIYNGNKNLNEPSEFYPSMMHQSNKSVQHLKITKKFNKLGAKVKFYGIDIQIAKYPELYEMLNTKHNTKLKKLIDKYKDQYLKDPISGKARNKYNAFIINDLILDENKNKKNKNIYLYFAHNQHISIDCNQTRKDENYKTEGFYLNNNNKIKYLSIATFSQYQYSLWEYDQIHKIKEYITKSKKWDKIFEENNNNSIILDSDNNKYKLPMLNDNYSDDFHYTICEKYSNKPELL